MLKQMRVSHSHQSYLARRLRTFRGRQICAIFMNLAVIVTFSALANPAFSYSRENEVPCKSDNYSVVSPDVKSGTLACEGIRRAIQFFDELDVGVLLNLHPEFTVYITEQFPEEYRSQNITSDHYFGFVPVGRNEVYIVPYFVYEKSQNTLFNIPPNEEMYIGRVAHEVAHILTQANYSTHKYSSVPIEQAEYIGYAVQIQTMDPEPDSLGPNRSAVLQAFHQKGWVEGFTGDRDISEMHYLGNTEAFAVRAFNHYHSSAGPSYVGQVLKGERRSYPLPAYARN